MYTGCRVGFSFFPPRERCPEKFRRFPSCHFPVRVVRTWFSFGLFAKTKKPFYFPFPTLTGCKLENQSVAPPLLPHEKIFSHKNHLVVTLWSFIFGYGRQAIFCRSEREEDIYELTVIIYLKIFFANNISFHHHPLYAIPPAQNPYSAIA